MSFEKLRNLFNKALEPSDNQESILEKASNFIASTRRSVPENTTSDFDEYLQALPQSDIKILLTRKHRSSRTASLKPQLVKKCYENVPNEYFDPNHGVET